MSEVCHRFDPYPQVLRNVRYQGASPLESGKVKAAIREHEALLGAEGRVLIRPSGTEPVIRVMVEGADAGQIDSSVSELCGVIEAEAAGMESA